MAEARISVRSDLLKIVEDLKVISQTANETAESLSAATKQLGEEVNDQVSVVDGGMRKIKKFGQDLVKQLASDFKALFSVSALAGGLKLSEQFAGTVRQAVTLNDTMRSLAPIFGMTEAKAEAFKRTLIQGLGEIGLGSEAAANALQGLAETPVRGERALKTYAETAGELAGISGQKGQEGAISKGLSSVVVAQGGNPNDPKAMQRVAEDVLRIRNATGQSATEILGTLNNLFKNVNQDFKKTLTQGGAVSLAAAGRIGGQGSTAFLERYLGLSTQERAGLEAQGLGRLMGPGGKLNLRAFESTLREAKRRGGGNTEFGLTTMHMNDEEAKGFIRLTEAMEQSNGGLDKLVHSLINIHKQFQDTITFGDAFRANLNKVKGAFAGILEKVHAPDLLNKGTDLLQKASQSTAGSAAVVGGGALLAAMLTGKGLGGIGSLLGGEAKKSAIEAITGEKIQRVEVVNFPSGFGASGLLGAGGSAASLAGLLVPALKLGGVASVGLAAGALAGEGVNRLIKGTAVDKGMTAAVADLARALGILPKVIEASHKPKDMHLIVHTKSKDLKAYPAGSRGPHQ